MQEATRLVIEDAIRREEQTAERHERAAAELLAQAVDADTLAAEARTRAVIHRQALAPVTFVLTGISPFDPRGLGEYGRHVG